MLKKRLKAPGEALAIFICHGHAFMFLLLPLLGLLTVSPASNLFTASRPHHVVAALQLSGLVLCFTAIFERKCRLNVSLWLGAMTGYGWLAASAILRPAPVVLWSRERDMLDQIIVAPIALWVASVVFLVVGGVGFCLFLLFSKARSMPAV